MKKATHAGKGKKKPAHTKKGYVEKESPANARHSRKVPSLAFKGKS